MRSGKLVGRAVAATLALLLLAACSKQEVYSGLTEVEANEITATLLSNGIRASKTTMGDKGSSVSVDQDQFLLAIKILRDAGLPRQAKEDLGVIFKKSGITSTPFEERVRFTYGLSQEIEKTLNSIDGVVVSRVHLVLPEAPEFGKQVQPSSASVFIKHRSGVDIEFLTPQIRRLVSNAIEGLSYAAVNVTTVEAQPATVFFRTDPTTMPQFRDSRSAPEKFFSDWRNLALSAVLLAGIGAGGFFGFRHYRARTATAAATGADAEDRT
jgi:type III secretion protein J